MNVSIRRLVTWTLTTALVLLGSADWRYGREAKRAQQLYHLQDARYDELLAKAIDDVASVRASDLDSIRQARDSAREKYDERSRASDTLSLWLMVLLLVYLVFDWLGDRIDRKKDGADAG